MQKITFDSEHVKITGPSQIGNVQITFTTSDYQWEQIKDLPTMNGKVFKVEVSSA